MSNTELIQHIEAKLSEYKRKNELTFNLSDPKLKQPMYLEFDDAGGIVLSEKEVSQLIALAKIGAGGVRYIANFELKQ